MLRVKYHDVTLQLLRSFISFPRTINCQRQQYINKIACVFNLYICMFLRASDDVFSSSQTVNLSMLPDPSFNFQSFLLFYFLLNNFSHTNPSFIFAVRTNTILSRQAIVAVAVSDLSSFFW